MMIILKVHLELKAAELGYNLMSLILAARLQRLHMRKHSETVWKYFSPQAFYSNNLIENVEELSY